jgi:hypothetical protein
MMGSEIGSHEDRCVYCQMHVDNLLGDTLSQSLPQLGDRFGLDADDIRAAVGLAAIKVAVDAYTHDLALPIDRRDELIVHVNYLLRGARECRSDAPDELDFDD